MKTSMLVNGIMNVVFVIICYAAMIHLLFTLSPKHAVVIIASGALAELARYLYTRESEKEQEAAYEKLFNKAIGLSPVEGEEKDE